MPAEAGQEVTRLLYTGDSPQSGGSEEGERDEDGSHSDCRDERLAAFDAAVAEIAAPVLSVHRGSEDWLERTRASLLALLGAFDERPETARLLIGDSIAWGPEVLERRGELLEVLAEALDDPRGKLDPVEPLPETTGENLVGASLSWIHARLEGEGGKFVELAPSLTSMIVHAYLGPEAAQQELERPSTGLGVEVVERERRDPIVSPDAVSAQGSSPSQPFISRLRGTPS
ncbi:MAG TPA: hypothetical protein VK730_02260 [Solirubrobacteraceae bacterium]|jgi:hypothetical protein|nr:hypothetical protein [Solirubrobacteraceae bacterium]